MPRRPRTLCTVASSRMPLFLLSTHLVLVFRTTSLVATVAAVVAVAAGIEVLVAPTETSPIAATDLPAAIDPLVATTAASMTAAMIAVATTAAMTAVTIAGVAMTAVVTTAAAAHPQFADAVHPPNLLAVALHLAEKYNI
jgi:hypothetical protein